MIIITTSFIVDNTFGYTCITKCSIWSTSWFCCLCLILLPMFDFVGYVWFCCLCLIFVGYVWFCWLCLILLAMFGFVAYVGFCCLCWILLPMFDFVGYVWLCCLCLILLPIFDSVAYVWFCLFILSGSRSPFSAHRQPQPVVQGNGRGGTAQGKNGTL